MTFAHIGLPGDVARNEGAPEEWSADPRLPIEPSR
jgi:hypothetical protein